MKKAALVLAAVTILAAGRVASADVAPAPKQQATRVVVPVTIKHGAIRGEDRSVQAKIIIPKWWVQSGGSLFRSPSGTAAPGAGEKSPSEKAPGEKASSEKAPSEKASDAKKETRSNVPPLGTIIAGLALSLAAVSLVFVVRGNRTTRTAALAVLAGAIVLGGYSAAQADLVPGRRPAPRNEIVIELVDEGDSVTLLLAQ